MRKGIIGPILVLVIGAFVAITFVIPNIHFGRGTGDGRDMASGSSVSASAPSELDTSEETGTSEIRVKGNEIFFDDVRCTDENELKQKITDIGAEREYVFVDDYAIKSTYDKVDEVLTELKNALDINIKYRTH